MRDNGDRIAPPRIIPVAITPAGPWVERDVPDSETPPSGGGSGSSSGGGGAASGDTDPAPADPSPTAAPPTSPGPRNPWLPPTEGPRRSAGIDDIFRPRPRTGGSGNNGIGSGVGSAGMRGNGAAGQRPGFAGWAGQLLHLPPRRDGKSWLPLGLGALALVWLFATAAHQLGSTQQGLVTTFGKYSHVIGPGVNFTAPWPIQGVAVTDVTSIRRDSIPEGDGQKLMLTSDQNLVDLSYIVRWNIKDLKLYAYQLDNPHATIEEVAEAAMRASVAEVRLNDVMGGAGRAQIEQDVRQRMQAILDAYRAGVIIQGVDIKKADPPAQVNDAFQKVTVAQQGANRDLSNAQGYAQQVVARAQGDTAQFNQLYTQYKLAPEVTRRRMYYETMERVLANNDKVITGNNTSSYLPLPQLVHKAPEAVTGTAP